MLSPTRSPAQWPTGTFPCNGSKQNGDRLPSPLSTHRRSLTQVGILLQPVRLHNGLEVHSRAPAATAATICGPRPGCLDCDLLDLGMAVESLSMGWLKDHVFIAAWCSPIIALVGLIIRNTIRPTERVNWSMIMLYVAFLTCLAAALTPSLDIGTRTIAGVMGGLILGTITTDAIWWKK